MKKYSVFKCILFTAAILFLGGCVEDKGNSDYTATNKMTITGLEKHYIYPIGETVTIHPEIKWDIPIDEKDLSYFWLNFAPNTVDVPFDTIWNEKYMTNIVPRLPARENTLAYKVRNNLTGVEYSSDLFTIDIKNDIQKGFLVLTENNGKTDLKILNYVNSTSTNKYLDGTFHLRTVDLSSLPELGRPYDIDCYDDYMNAPTLGNRTDECAIRFVTETGLYTLSRVDLHYEDLYHGSYFIVGGDPSTLGLRKLISPPTGGQWNALLMDKDNNYMFYRGGSVTNTFWTKDVFVNSYAQPAGAPAKRFSALAPPAAAFNMLSSNTAYLAAVLYDTDSKSFAFRFGANAMFCSNYEDAKATRFKFNNTDFTPRFIYYRPASDTPTGSQVYSIVKQNDADEMYLLKWAVNTGDQTFKQQLYPTSDKPGVVLPGILDAKLFAMGNSSLVDQRPFIFYAFENKVYVYNYIDMNVDLAWSAPEGNTITRIEVMTKRASQMVDVGCPFNDHLVVVSDAADGTSTLEVCKITDTTGICTLGEAGPEGEKAKMTWSGLPKIVKVTWKLL